MDKNLNNQPQMNANLQQQYMSMQEPNINVQKKALV